MPVIYKPFLEKLGGSTSASQFIGSSGELFYDPATTTLRISDGSTPGGTVIVGSGGENPFDQDLNTDNDVMFNRVVSLTGELISGYGSNFTLTTTVDGSTENTLTFDVYGTLFTPRRIVGNEGIFLTGNDGESYTSIYLPTDSLSGSEAASIGNYNDTGSVVISAYSSNWSFGYDGGLTLPSGTVIKDIGISGGENPTAGIGIGYGNFTIATGSALNDWALFQGAGLIKLSADDTLYLESANVVTIGAGAEGPSWSFDPEGGITFPDSTIQTGAAISLTDLKTLVAASTDFDDFKTRIAAL